jgi:hypothetical protein
VSSTHITYSTRPEAELTALAACYRIILDSANRRGRLPDKSGPDDEKERSSNDSLASNHSTA